MELKRLLETLPPDFSEDTNSADDRNKKFKKRQSLVKFRQAEPSYTNENYESDEENASNKGPGKDATSSTDRGEKIWIVLFR